jgi:hypothetical protein
MALSLLYYSVTIEAGGQDEEAKDKGMEETHKRSSTVGISYKGNGKDLSLVGFNMGHSPKQVKDLGKIANKPQTGCCHKGKRERM